jgi:hypothetical protein
MPSSPGAAAALAAGSSVCGSEPDSERSSPSNPNQPGSGDIDIVTALNLLGYEGLVVWLNDSGGTRPKEHVYLDSEDEEEESEGEGERGGERGGGVGSIRRATNPEAAPHGVGEGGKRIEFDMVFKLKDLYNPELSSVLIRACDKKYTDHLFGREAMF